MRYRGRDFSDADIAAIRLITEENAGMSRAGLSRKVCEHFAWRKPDGGLKDMACRVAMLEMERDGLIRLPAPRQAAGRLRGAIKTHVAAAEPGAPIHEDIAALGSGIRLASVRLGPESDLWNDLVHRYHYLGYQRPGGAQMRYLAYAGDRVLGCLAFSGAAWKTRPRDEFIGWTADIREKRLHLVVDNSRFLILPWVKVPNLATKLLSMAARRLPDDWQARYNYRPLLIETFVDKERFLGTCYKAANWIYVGETQGRGRYDTKHLAHGKSVKTIWCLPLSRRFREGLAGNVNGVANG
jgi:hypothetical protein